MGRLSHCGRTWLSLYNPALLLLLLLVYSLTGQSRVVRVGLLLDQVISCDLLKTNY